MSACEVHLGKEKHGTVTKFDEYAWSVSAVTSKGFKLAFMELYASSTTTLRPADTRIKISKKKKKN